MNSGNLKIIAKKEMSGLVSEKTIILAIILQVFIAMFSSFLLVGLEEIPHYTTLQKFLSRIPSLTFRIILKNVIRRLHQKGEIIRITSIDSTGFTSSYASHYYSKRINKTRKSFIKASIAVDSDKLIILG